jgi:biopolymer transport protein ExbD
MKFRNTDMSNDRIEVPMAPMIDVVFQLLIFFILTLKIVEPEGDFHINMPVGAPVPANPEDPKIPPIKVRLVAAADGSLRQLFLSRRSLGKGDAAFRRLNNEILKIIGQPGNPQNKDVEVEIDADYDLHHQYTLRAFSACRGHLDPTTQEIIEYVEKINFAPLRKPGEQ